jgi:hypothetical protein
LIPEQKRRAQLDRLGGKIEQARRSGATLTCRVAFETAADANNAATKLRSLGWGASVDRFTVRALAVVA